MKSGFQDSIINFIAEMVVGMIPPKPLGAEKVA
jgi:hypothetical protein